MSPRGSTPNPAGVLSTGYTQAQIEAIAAAAGAAAGGSVANAVVTLSTISASAIQTAVNALPSAGGKIILPAGQGDITSTVTLKSGVTIEGAGTYATKLIVKGDYPAFSCVGTSSGSRNHRVRLRHMSIDNENGVTYTTQPLVYFKYSDTCVFEHLTFLNKKGCGFKCDSLWDSIFFNCRWDLCGGTDGLHPAMLVNNTTDDNSNNLAFYNCTWETFRDGGIWVVGEGLNGEAFTRAPEVFHFFNCKWDAVSSALGPFGLFSQVTNIKIFGGSVSINLPGVGASTFNAFVFRKAALDTTVRDIQLLWGGGQTTVASGFAFDGTSGSNIGITLHNVSGSTSGTSGPTTALITFTGTNESVQIGPVYWRRNGGTFPLFSGSPTHVTPGMRLSTKAGTFSDSDFASSIPGTPGGGAQLIGVDTTNSRLYVRLADGTYKYASLT